MNKTCELAGCDKAVPDGSRKYCSRRHANLAARRAMNARRSKVRIAGPVTRKRRLCLSCLEKGRSEKRSMFPSDGTWNRICPSCAGEVGRDARAVAPCHIRFGNDHRHRENI